MDKEKVADPCTWCDCWDADYGTCTWANGSYDECDRVKEWREANED